MPKERLAISDSALKAVIEGYAREAGVRQLEKQLGKLVRKAVVKLLEDPQAVLKIAPKDLESYLGKPVFRSEQVLSGVGVITGLAWTSMGGATLPIEATRIHTLNRGFKLTGKLGDVMKESAEIAYSFVTSNLKTFKGDPQFFDQAFVHLRAGRRDTQGRPQRRHHHGQRTAVAGTQPAAEGRGVAMTGELTLTGHVLPIGGVREGHRRAAAEALRADPAGSQPWRLRRAAGLPEGRADGALRQALRRCGQGALLSRNSLRGADGALAP